MGIRWNLIPIHNNHRNVNECQFDDLVIINDIDDIYIYIYIEIPSGKLTVRPCHSSGLED